MIDFFQDSITALVRDILSYAEKTIGKYNLDELI